MLPLTFASPPKESPETQLSARLVDLPTAEKKALQERLIASFDSAALAADDLLRIRVGTSREWRRFDDAHAFSRVFPGVALYEVRSGETWGGTNRRCLAELDGKFYEMPNDFNLLLRACGITVSDTNVVECAEAFVALELAARPPEDSAALKQGLVFKARVLDAKRIKQRISHTEYHCLVSVTVSGKRGEWFFQVRQGFFMSLLSTRPGGRAYRDFLRSDLQRPGPNLDLGETVQVDTLSPSCASVEHGGAGPHYYCTVWQDGAATGDSVRFLLHGFDTERARRVSRTMTRKFLD
jgi:hypothetical protein